MAKLNCQEQMEKVLESCIKEEKSVKSSINRIFRGLDYVTQYNWSSDVYIEAGVYDLPLYETWRIVSNSKIIMFPKNQNNTDKLVEIVKQKLSEDKSILPKCNYSIKNNLFRITMDQTYFLNDVYKFDPIPIKESKPNWYTLYTSFFNNIFYKSPHMLWEDQSTYTRGIIIECECECK
jgi:hypothetical protein